MITLTTAMFGLTFAGQGLALTFLYLGAGLFAFAVVSRVMLLVAPWDKQGRGMKVFMRCWWIILGFGVLLLALSYIL